MSVLLGSNARLRGSGGIGSRLIMLQSVRLTPVMTCLLAWQGVQLKLFVGSSVNLLKGLGSDSIAATLLAMSLSMPSVRCRQL